MERCTAKQGTDQGDSLTHEESWEKCRRAVKIVLNLSSSSMAAMERWAIIGVVLLVSSSIHAQLMEEDSSDAETFSFADAIINYGKLLQCVIDSLNITGSKVFKSIKLW